MRAAHSKSYFWRIVSPLLIYWGITLLVKTIITTIYSFITIMPYFMQQLSIHNELNQEVQRVLMNEMNEISSTFMQTHGLHLMIVSGCVSLIYTVFMYKKDRSITQWESTNETPAQVLPFHAQLVSAQTYLWLLPLAASICYGLNGLLVLVQVAYPDLALESLSEQMLSAPLVLQVIGIAVVMPIAEEMLFRGLLFRRFRERQGFLVAAFFTSWIYGFVYGSFIRIIYTFIVSMLLCYVYEVYGSIKAPILMHVMVNLLSIVATHVTVFALPLRSFQSIAVTVVLCAVCGASVFVKLMTLRGQMLHKC